MSAVCLRLITTVSLFYTTLGKNENSTVVWRDVGGFITIQCRTSEPGQILMELEKGLNGEFDVVVKDKSKEPTVAKEFKGRLQLHGVFPYLDIVITNLTSDDTGLYWCIYKGFDAVSSSSKDTKGTGSVLLVVTDPQCEQPNRSIILVTVVISAMVLTVILVVFLVWSIYKTKKFKATMKPRRIPNNDVYEDMRGTIRH
ncbi:uncharacterized protein ACBR49_013013 isoform 2-T2 [Aulostomus maculatus]